jgi:hypothetical protein
MDPRQTDRWKSEVLDQVFVALAASEAITSALVFKGARILVKRLESTYRQSTDIDSNLLEEFVEQNKQRQSQADYLEKHAAAAIKRYFESQEPVRYELTQVRAILKPPSEHPQGWNAILLRVTVKDLTKPLVLGLPALTIDVAAPEELLDTSVAPLLVGENEVKAYTLERLTGEKLRAFLSSLPAYREKLNRPGDAIRVKDIYDLAVVGKKHPLEQTEFWQQVGEEFKVACRSRFIDCQGIETFEAVLERTRTLYDLDPTLPKDVPFDEAWIFLREVVNFLQTKQVLPFNFPIP